MMDANKGDRAAHGSRLRLGGFRLLDTLDPVGAGSQGTVRCAVCERADFAGLSVGETVALKVMPVSEEGDARWQRLETMVSALSAIETPNVVHHYGCFRERDDAGDLHVVVMEFLEGMPGRTLRDALGAVRGCRLPTGDVLAAFVRYSHALALLHARGIVHRDIKPSNLYYRPDDVSKAVIMDLGTALDWKTTLTSGFVPGTPDYMPPEVITGSSEGSPASDIYALGFCLYEALTGQPAFPRFKRGESGAIEAFLVRARQMRAPKFDGPLVSANPDLESLLRPMTEPDIARRMSSAAEVEMELQELVDAFEQGDWSFPSARQVAETADGSDESAVDERTVEVRTDAPKSDVVPADVPPIPFLRRLIRNRRELFLVIALVIELLSNVIIIWQRPRPRVSSAPSLAGEERGK